MDTSKKYFLRDVIGGYMKTVGEKEPLSVMVNADLMGTCRNRSFAETFPERSFNVGIAEQNMISFAAGLAHEGFIPYTFSMAPFISMRACEQVRTDVAYENLSVRLIAPYAGLSGGISGATHWSMEDCGIMTSFANMTVLEPCDPVQAERMMDFTITHKGPVYLRVSVEPVYSIYSEDYTFEPGRATLIREGSDGAFLCSGITVKYAIEAAEILEREHGLSVSVTDMASIKPIDREAVLAAAKTGAVIAAQDHNIYGGLGQAAGNVIAESGIGTRFRTVGITDTFMSMAHAEYLYHHFGYDTEGLVRNMLELKGMV